MPYILDVDSRTDTLAAAINQVLVRHGPAGLTLRAIARVSGVSPGSMLHHLGSREHLIRVAAGQTGRARCLAIESRAWMEGPLAFLPVTGDDVPRLARGWPGWSCGAVKTPSSAP